ncbi:MAG: hypothetical protein AABX11_07115, partial [Nanoarchaeota archaeon]
GNLGNDGNGNLGNDGNGNLGNDGNGNGNSESVVPETSSEIISSETSVGVGSSEIVVPETSSEIISSETSAESTSSDGAESVESSESESLVSSITGEVISENEFEIEGNAKKGSDFVYNLENKQSAEIVEGSVNVGGVEIGDDKIKLKIKGDVLEAVTEYSIEEEGFGSDYSGDERLTLSIDLSKFNLKAIDKSVAIKLVYNDVIIAESEKKIKLDDNNVSVPVDEENTTDVLTGINESNLTILNETILNESLLGNITNVTLSNIQLIRNISTLRMLSGSSAFLDMSEYFSGAENYSISFIKNITTTISGNNVEFISDAGFYGARKAKITAYFGEETLESNSFNILVSSGVANVVTSREKIRVGDLVKWTKNVTLDNPEATSVIIPAGASNVSVKKGIDGEVVSAELRGISGNVVLESDSSQGILSKLFNRIFGVFRSISGRVVSDLVEQSVNSSDDVEVVLDDNVTNYIIEYYTASPQLNVSDTNWGKRVVVSGPDSVLYEDVIAFTNLSNRIRIEDASNIKVYWLTKTNVTFVSKKAEDVDDVKVVEEITGDEFNSTSEVDAVVIENVGDVNSSELVGSLDNFSEQNNSSVESVDENQTEENLMGITAQVIDGEILNEQVNVSNENVGNESSNVINESSLDSIIVNETQDNVSVSQAVSERQEMLFDAYDLDEDGFVDYIEWVVPHLSEQTFEIIEISSAAHLDSNRAFVEDIYDYVNAQDNNWTYVPAGDYVRVTFEKNLTNKNDITIYAKPNDCNNVSVINGQEVPCAIYEKKKRLDELRRLMG